MKMKLTSLKQQTQDYLLRLFVAPSEAEGDSLHSEFYTCAHVGTHARLHQYYP
jgi:hypothetical protein